LAESSNKINEFKVLPVHDMVDQIRIMIIRLWKLRARLGDLLQGMDKLHAVVEQVFNRSRNLANLCVEKPSLRVLKSEIQRPEQGMLLTLKSMNAPSLSGNTVENLVNTPSFFWSPNPS
jgi:hypothetical protein